MEDVIREANYSVCTKCGTIRATMSHHDCGAAEADDPDNHRPSPAERKARREADTGDPSEIVKTSPKSASSGAYAYHEVDENGAAICNPGNDETDLEAVTREEAQERRKCPCQMCQRIV